MTSRTTVLAVVIGLIIITLLCVGGAIALVWGNHEVPDQLWNIALVCVGAVAGILATTRSTIGPNEQEPSTFQATLTAVQPVEQTRA